MLQNIVLYLKIERVHNDIKTEFCQSPWCLLEHDLSHPKTVVVSDLQHSISQNYLQKVK